MFTGNKKNTSKEKSIFSNFFSLLKPKKNIPLKKPDDIKADGRKQKKNSSLIVAYAEKTFGGRPLDFPPTPLVHKTFEEIILPSGYNIISLSALSTAKKKYKRILFYDIDGTIFDDKSKTFKIIEKDNLIEELTLAIDNNDLVGILTARNYSPLQFGKSLISTQSILEDVGINFFKFIIFTNGKMKSIPMMELSRHYNLPHDHLRLVDDDSDQLYDCREQNLKVIDATLETRHQKVISFLKNSHELIDKKIDEEETKKISPFFTKFISLEQENKSAFLPPPLELISHEPTCEIQIINSINGRLKACFIFTTDWLEELKSTSASDLIELIDFFKKSVQTQVAFILITKEKYNPSKLEEYLKNPILSPYFYSIGYTNENPSYEELLKTVIKYTALPPTHISLIGNTYDVVTYYRLFGFRKATLSPAYIAQMRHEYNDIIRNKAGKIQLTDSTLTQPDLALQGRSR